MCFTFGACVTAVLLEICNVLLCSEMYDVDINTSVDHNSTMPVILYGDTPLFHAAVR